MSDRATRWPTRRPAGQPPCSRGRGAIELDLKTDAGLELVQKLVSHVDVLDRGASGPGSRSGSRPRPDWCLEQSTPGSCTAARLVGGRMGRTPSSLDTTHQLHRRVGGPRTRSGAAARPPAVPLNLVGDYAAGGMLLLYGVLLALFECERSGSGQVVDAAMSDGVAVMMAEYQSLRDAGRWNRERGTNEADSGAHYYDVYRTSDDRFVAVGAIEPQPSTLRSSRVSASPICLTAPMIRPAGRS